jgi:hypothetical protein
MTDWNYLPNAAHIDQVLSDLAVCSYAFGSSYQRTRSTEGEPEWSPRFAAWEVAQDVVHDAAKNTAWNAARDAAWDTVSDMPVDMERWDSGQDAILALIAYDHSDRYLTMTADQLRVWCALGADPAAVLLLPYVTLFEHAAIKEQV